MVELEAWEWPIRPVTDDEFERMMSSVDRHLASCGLGPDQRMLHAGHLISKSLGLTGVMFEVPYRARPIFGDDDILIRVGEWYRVTYGELTKIDMSLGSVIFHHEGNYWRMCIYRPLGRVRLFMDRNLNNAGQRQGSRGKPATLNVFTSITHLTQAYVNRLSDADAERAFRLYVKGIHALSVMESLRDSELFVQARLDYIQSVNEILNSGAYNKAKWDISQAAEKTIKGMLGRAGYDGYPRSSGKGHDLLFLNGLMREKLGINVQDSVLRSMNCLPAVRYGEINVDKNAAWTSHMDFLEFLCQLARAPNAAIAPTIQIDSVK